VLDGNTQNCATRKNSGQTNRGQTNRGQTKKRKRIVMKTRVDATVAVRRVVAALQREDGAATAEYAVATMAAVGFAGLLVVILRGDEVRGILTDLVRRALTVSV
jgi:hypothetical protein